MEAVEMYTEQCHFCLSIEFLSISTGTQDFHSQTCGLQMFGESLQQVVMLRLRVEMLVFYFFLSRM